MSLDKNPSSGRRPSKGCIFKPFERLQTLEELIKYQAFRRLY